jgi:hypothetical protein
MLSGHLDSFLWEELLPSSWAWEGCSFFTSTCDSKKGSLAERGRDWLRNLGAPPNDFAAS